MFEIDDVSLDEFAKIKVIGVGSDGLKAINHMIDSALKGVEFLVLDTDAQKLNSSKATDKILIDSDTLEKISETLDGFDIIFFVAGLDNSPAANFTSKVAEFAEMNDALKIATLVRYDDTSDKILSELEWNVDALISIPRDAEQNVEKFFTEIVRIISDLIAVPGLVNLDLRDVQSIMSNAGKTVICFGEATGEKATADAVKATVDSSLSEMKLKGAHGILLNITAATDLLSMRTVKEACEILQESTHPDAEIIWGVRVNDSLGDKVSVTIIATKFDYET